MTPGQAWALTHPIKSTEELQALLNKPKIFKFPSQVVARIAAVVTCVAQEADGYKWTTNVRVVIPKNRKTRPPAKWLPFERNTVLRMLYSELEGVGLEESDVQWDTDHSAWMTRKLTGAELTEMVKPNILGNGHKPKVTSTQAAQELLTQMEKALEERPRIIKPNLN